MVRGAQPSPVRLEEGAGRAGCGRFILHGLCGLVATLLSSASGEKQDCSSGAGHAAAVPAGPRQRPAAVQEPAGQPAHQPLSLPQPQGNRGIFRQSGRGGTDRRASKLASWTSSRGVTESGGERRVLRLDPHSLLFFLRSECHSE